MVHQHYLLGHRCRAALLHLQVHPFAVLEHREQALQGGLVLAAIAVEQVAEIQLVPFRLAEIDDIVLGNGACDRVPLQPGEGIGSRIPLQDVVAHPSDQDVVAQAAAQHVVAGPAVQGVVACITGKFVVTPLAEEDVVSQASIQLVMAATSITRHIK
ncbi:hypothetical protein D3C79_579410 [compost metagenome]